MGERIIAPFVAYHPKRTFAKDIALTQENTEKTLIQFWKDNNTYDCLKNLAWALDGDTKECMNNIQKKTLKRFVHDFKGFSKNEEIVKIKKAVVEMANNFNLGMDENDIEELLEVVLE